MVRGCHDGLDSPSPRELLENFRAKLGTAIGSDGGRDAECLNPSKRKTVDDALGGYVDEGNSYWPSGEAVHDC